jgi:hypothetical protein
MFLEQLFSWSPVQICWRASPNLLQLALAAVLLLGAALGTRWLAGNTRWVRALIALAGLVVFAVAWLGFGQRCDSTLKILERALNAGVGVPDVSATAATGPLRCADRRADRQASEPPNFYAGPAYLTYDRLLRELHRRACLDPDAPDFGIRNSLGSVDTMWVINGPANAAWGLVQGDIKLFLQQLELDDLRLLGLKADAQTRAHLQRTVDQMVLRRPMHLEAVHVISNNPQVRRFADLAGRSVLVPSDSQGSVISAFNLLRAHGLSTSVLRADAGALEQLAKVIDGQADALVITAGVPARLLNAVAALPAERRRSLHLVEFDSGALPAVYRLQPVHYPEWQAAPVQVPIVRALWVGWDFSARKTPAFKLKCEQTRQLDAVLQDSLPRLQADPVAHPAWKTIDLDERVPGWPGSRC